MSSIRRQMTATNWKFCRGCDSDSQTASTIYQHHNFGNIFVQTSALNQCNRESEYHCVEDCTRLANEWFHLELEKLDKFDRVRWPGPKVIWSFLLSDFSWKCYLNWGWECPSVNWKGFTVILKTLKLAKICFRHFLE